MAVPTGAAIFAALQRVTPRCGRKQVSWDAKGISGASRTGFPVFGARNSHPHALPALVVKVCSVGMQRIFPALTSPPRRRRLAFTPHVPDPAAIAATDRVAAVIADALDGLVEISAAAPIVAPVLAPRTRRRLMQTRSGRGR